MKVCKCKAQCEECEGIKFLDFVVEEIKSLVRKHKVVLIIVIVLVLIFMFATSDSHDDRSSEFDTAQRLEQIERY